MVIRHKQRHFRRKRVHPAGMMQAEPFFCSRDSAYDNSRVLKKHFLYNNKKYTGGGGSFPLATKSSLTFVRCGLVRHPLYGGSIAAPVTPLLFVIASGAKQSIFYFFNNFIWSRSAGGDAYFF